MNNTKDIFSEALNPENEDNWVPVVRAKSRHSRTDIYRVVLPGTSVHTFRGEDLTNSLSAWGLTELEPDADELPTMTVPTYCVYQYCPAPTLPTEALSDIYNVETNNYDGSGALKFTRMVLHPDGYWLGVDPDDGEAHYIHSEDILEFSLTPEKS